MISFRSQKNHWVIFNYILGNSGLVSSDSWVLPPGFRECFNYFFHTPRSWAWYWFAFCSDQFYFNHKSIMTLKAAYKTFYLWLVFFSSLYSKSSNCFQKAATSNTTAGRKIWIKDELLILVHHFFKSFSISLLSHDFFHISDMYTIFQKQQPKTWQLRRIKTRMKK